MILSARSEKNLVGVHPDLVKVILRAAENVSHPFIVTEGRRTLARQTQLVAAGRSRTMNSRHLTGHAVDLAVFLPGGGVSWDARDYRLLAMSVKAAASELRIPIEWGGDWISWQDAPHFQLPHAVYPADVNLQPEGQVNQT